MFTIDIADESSLRAAVPSTRCPHHAELDEVAKSGCSFHITGKVKIL
jgi:hypothetical protein